MDKLNCEYCNKLFSNKGSLVCHQKSAKYCLNIQGESNFKFTCDHCDKKLSTKNRLLTHLLVCDKVKEKNHETKIISIKSEHENEINFLKEKIAEQQMLIETQYTQIKELQDKLENIALSGMSATKENIALTKRYVKKASRVQYESNVIYMLTTDRLRKDRVYIIGKAKNLTNRLSTYNKTDEHEVVYYQECPDEDIMNIVESLVLKKMEKYREQANRDRFVLPEGEDVEIFKEIMRESVKFLKG
jgi:hypothetical protein